MSKCDSYKTSFAHAYFGTVDEATKVFQRSSVNDKGWDICFSSNIYDLVDAGFEALIMSESADSKQNWCL